MKEKGISRRQFIKGTATLAAAATVSSFGFPNILKGAAPEILIGQIYPLSGPLATDGEEMKKAVLWGIDEVNNAGGIKSLDGAKLKLIDADSEGKPEKSISEVERLDREGVVAITGCYQSAVTIVATQVSEKLGIPFVVGVAAANEITERGFKYTFRTQPTASIYALHTLKYISEVAKAADQSVKTIAHLHENTQFGSDISEYVMKLAPQFGLEVIDKVSYSPKAADLSTEVGKIKAANADLIFTTGYLGDGVRVVQTMNKMRVKTKAIVGCANGAFGYKQFVSEMGGMTEGLIDCNSFYNPKSARAKKVMEGFKAKYGSNMTSSMGYAYQAIPIIADAIERAKSTKREAIRNALVETNFSDHIMPQGPIIFGTDGQNKNATPLLLQIQNAKLEAVWPKDYATTNVIFPWQGWQGL